MRTIRFLARRGDGIAHRLSNHPAVNAELSSRAGDRSFTKLVLSSDVLK
jgi:hypothetical protein